MFPRFSKSRSARRGKPGYPGAEASGDRPQRIEIGHWASMKIEEGGHEDRNRKAS